MTSSRAPRGRRLVGPWALVLVAALVGVVLVVVGLVSQEPEPPRLAEPQGRLGPSPAREDVPGPAASPRATKPQDRPLGPSEPVSISIPAIDVRSEVFALGKTRDGALAVPQPGPNLDKAAWFENSPTPGQPGPSVIEGHVSTDEGGPSVFFDLAEITPGDRISVARGDGKLVVFTVTALREFAKDRFPTNLVYGGDISQPTLRLITCSGFDPRVGNHTSNLIVFAEMTRVRRV